MPTARSKERRRLEEAIDHKIAFIQMFLHPTCWRYQPLSRHIRNKIKMRAKGLARCAFELRPDLREGE